MKKKLVHLALVAMVLSACTTTEEAQQVIQSRWIGQPVEAFFIRHGPPVSEFAMQSGNVIYTWRGGDTTRYIAPTYTSAQPAQATVRTETRETQPGVTVTETRVVGVTPGRPAQMISPPRYEDLFCELQITVDTTQIIRNIRASNDTDGEGLSLSRCAEVLDAHPEKRR